MRSLPITLRWYLSVVYLGTLLLVAAQIPIVVALRLSTQDHALLILGGFIAATYISESERALLAVTPSVNFVPSKPLHIASILLLPPPLPMLIALLSVTAAQFPQPTPLHKRLFNVANVTIVVGLSSIVYTRTISPLSSGDALHPDHIAGAILPIALLICVYHMLNYVLLSGVLGASARRNPWRLWRENLQATVLLDAATSTLGVLAVLLWRYSPFGLVVLLVPLAALYGAARGIPQVLAVRTQAIADRERVATDALTDLPNHRAFQERLGEEVYRAGRYGQSLSLLLVDLDDFRRINTAYGSQAGDTALRRVAATLRQAVRMCDVVAYYGEDEFAIILAETDVDGARTVAARIHETVTDLEIVHDVATFHIDCTIGVAMLRYNCTKP